MNNTKKFAVNALIMTATSLIMSGVSMSFTVFISSRIGASGVGLYQLIMTVYRLAVTFATGGIGLATTRLVSEESAVGNNGGAVRAVRYCLFYALTLSVVSGAALLIFSKHIALYWLSDMRTLRPIRILAFSLPALAASSVMCGYFTAIRRVIKNSAVLMWEQYLKITLSVYLLSLSADSLENACCALVLSGTAAEIFSCITLGILYLFDRKKLSKNSAKATSGRVIRRRMLSIAVPVALTSYLRSGLSSVEQMMIPWGLKKYGLPESVSLAEYGIIGGMVMPVIMFPAVFVSSFSGLLVTEISACRALGAKSRINRIFHCVFRFTMLFSIAVAGVLWGFGGDIAMAMYHNPRAALFVRLLAPLVCVIYLDSVTDSMLKGLGLQKNHMRYNLIDSAVSVVLTVTLLPWLGINGYIIVITVSECLNFFLSFRKLISVTGFRPSVYREIVKPVTAVTLSVLIMRIPYRFMHSGASLPVCILFAIAIYAGILILMGCVTRRDAQFIKSKMKD